MAEEKSFRLQAAARLSFDFIERSIKIDLTFCQFINNQCVEFHIGVYFSTLCHYFQTHKIPKN
jgi:hypothetical protein